MTPPAHRLFVRLQNILPQHGLSRFAGRLANAATRPLRRALIRLFARRYDVDLTDAELPAPDDYPTFNAFFTRALREGSRPLPDDPEAIASPADGFLSQHGQIIDEELLQAKGRKYSAASLVSDGDIAAWLRGGSYLTIYLSPRDYHRVHAPAAATLQETIAIPGRLFSVNAVTEGHVESLFCKNERLVCVFDRYVLVLVGALVVASIVPRWPEAPTSPYRRRERARPAPRAFQRSDEVAHFEVGSTVIALFPPGVATLNADLAPGSRVRMGEALGVMRDRPERP